MPWPISLCNQEFAFIPINATFHDAPAKGINNILNVTGYWKIDFEDCKPCINYVYNGRTVDAVCESGCIIHKKEELSSFILEIDIASNSASGNY